MNSTGYEDILASPEASKLDVLIGILQDRLQRVPTQEEVLTFVNGTYIQRRGIWNRITIATIIQ